MTAAKKDNLFLQEVNAQVLQEVIGQVDKAFAFFKERGCGFPRFKKVGQLRSLNFPQPGVQPIRGNQLKVSKVGLMPLVLHRPIPDGFIIKSMRIVRKSSGWYLMLCLQADVEIPEVPPHGHSIGIDVSLEYFLSTSDGEQVNRVRFFNRRYRQLQLLQRCLKRKQKRSNNRAKLIQKIGRVQEQIAAYRLDQQFKLAHQLCDQAQIIFVEDLDFRIMAKGFLGKHTLDAGLGQFLNVVLPWVCFKRGVYYGKVDSSGTSQECPECGARVKKDLSVRVHQCHECGSVKPRDVAAAQVINARGLSGVQIASGRDLSGYQETDARQDRTKLEDFKSNLEKSALYV